MRRSPRVGGKISHPLLQAASRIHNRLPSAFRHRSSRISRVTIFSTSARGRESSHAVILRSRPPSTRGGLDAQIPCGVYGRDVVSFNDPDKRLGVFPGRSNRVFLAPAPADDDNFRLSALLYKILQTARQKLLGVVGAYDTTNGSHYSAFFLFALWRP